MEQEKLTKYRQMLIDSIKIAAVTYGDRSIEFQKANKELISQMIQMEEAMELNKEILETQKLILAELKLMNSGKIVEEVKTEEPVEVIKTKPKAPVKKTTTTK